MNYFYKVVDAPELKVKVEEAKRFFMKDLDICKDVTISFLELGNDNLSHRIDYFVDRFITGSL